MELIVSMDRWTAEISHFDRETGQPPFFVSLFSSALATAASLVVFRVFFASLSDSAPLPSCFFDRGAGTKTRNL